VVLGWAVVRGTLGVGACPDAADMVPHCEAAYPSPSGPRGAGRAPQTFGAGVLSREAVERGFSAVPDGGSKEPEIVSSVSDCVSTMHLLMTWVR